MSVTFRSVKIHGSLSLAVWALADAGVAGHAGTPLQRLQIVKLWLEEGAAMPDEYGACPSEAPEPGGSPFVTFFRELLRLIFQFLASLFSGIFGGGNVSFAR